MEPSGPATDEEPSSPFPLSPTLAFLTPGSSQPTYTTAGTIYNPSSSQRLQPPARRGRLLKLNLETTAFAIEATKFGSPRSILSDKAFRSDTSVNTPTAAPVQQYSPLQQNYDRAVSPVASPDREAGMSPQPFTLHNPPPLARLDSLPPSRIDKGQGPVATVDSSDDDDDSSSVGALKNMTVKSLQNLASYPNPNQKSAQKALLRGTRPKAGSSLGSGLSGLAQPFAYRNISPGGVRLSSSDEPSIGLRPTLSDSSALHHNFMNRRRISRVMTSDAGPSGTYASLFDSRRSTPSTNDDMPDCNPTASMHLATGPGAPKPLTAGPPGQRQYRPSTFESTFKALQSQVAACQASVTDAEDDLDAPPFTPRAYSTVASAAQYQCSSAEDEEYLSAAESIFNEAKAKAKPVATEKASDEEDKTPAISPDTLLYLTIHSEPEWPQDREPTHDVRGYTHRAHDIGGASVGNYNTPEQGFFDPVGSGYGASSNIPTNWQSKMHHGNSYHWDEPTGPMFPQQTGPKILTPQEIAERNWRLNARWYAGIVKDPYSSTVSPKPVDWSAKRPVTGSPYGAVGDGRPTQAKQNGSAARGDGAWLKSSTSMKSINSDAAGLALLGEVLSRAT